MSDGLVLVTGGSGFIGAHCIKRLHEDGHRVRTTVRSLAREQEVRDLVGDGPLEVVAADLTDDAGWGEAVARTCCTSPRRSRSFSPSTRTS
jgi:dihydroflavonol-4-reductase